MMRNGRWLFLCAVLLITTTNTAVAQTATGNGQKTLVVFFSRVGSSRPFTNIDAVSSASLPQGNTIVMAQMVHDVVGGDMFQVVTVNPYPAFYRETTELALQEQNAGARPRLATHVPNMADYDVIFLGYPNWWGTLPMALFTFLEEYDLAGKTIIPFCTHEGSQLGRSVEDIRKLEPRATVREGLAVRGGSVDKARGDVGRWLSRLGYK